MRSQSEFVFTEEMYVEDVVDTHGYKTNISSESNESGDSDNGGIQTTYEKDKEASLSEFYHVAMSLRKAMEAVRNTEMPWAPTAPDYSEENLLKIISVNLFNFISWCLNFSDVPEIVEHVQLDNFLKTKVLSICQGMLFLFSKGKMQTPKHQTPRL